jgi:TonB family protein
VLYLDPLAPRTPRLPDLHWGTLRQLTASLALHASLLLLAALATTTTTTPWTPDAQMRRAERAVEAEVRHIVFLAPEPQQLGRGGGGGGNRQPGPIRRAQGVGSDPITLRTRKTPPLPEPEPEPQPVAAVPLVEDVPPLPAVVLDAQPMASGLFDQIGLPAGGVLSSTSTGPGSGGGVGSGSGTGIGSGQGPGLGPGSGGGTGGGVYRPGGAVSAPRVVKNVKPKYTSDALFERIQGGVLLEAVVTTDGCATQIRVLKSLDRGGLDEEAVAAVAQWRFEPGRLAGKPVDVLVTIMIDFSIR